MSDLLFLMIVPATGLIAGVTVFLLFRDKPSVPPRDER